MFLISYSTRVHLLILHRNLNPGGYIELADICLPVQADDQSLPVESALSKWSHLMLESSVKAGRPLNSVKSYKSQLETAGFTNVVEVVYKWPQNRWPKDAKLKELGMFDFFAFHLSFFNLHISKSSHFTRLVSSLNEEVANRNNRNVEL
jgi:hypothetical protein